MNLKVHIREVDISNLQDALSVYKSCVCQHQKLGFNQWDDNYPSIDVIERDISKNWLFGGYIKDKLVALIAITQDEPKEYKSLNWQNKSNYTIVHRLCVHEDFLRKGIAKEMMIFAEHYSQKNNFLSIRLDTFSLNKGALLFYKSIGYSRVGYVNFTKRKDSNYTCFEKCI